MKGFEDLEITHVDIVGLTGNAHKLYARDGSLTQTEVGILYSTPGRGTNILTPWHRVQEVWYDKKKVPKSDPPNRVFVDVQVGEG
jgi:hypothetical protein